MWLAGKATAVSEIMALKGTVFGTSVCHMIVNTVCLIYNPISDHFQVFVLYCACWSTRRRSGRRRRTSPTCWHLSPVSSHWALSAQPPTATTSCRVHIASLPRGLSQSLHLKLGTGCGPNWKRPPVPLTVSNALLKHFYFSLSTAVKHVLADFCNAPSVRL